MPYSALPLAVTNEIRHQPACGQLLDLMRSWDFSCSVREIAAEWVIFDRSDQHKSTQPHSYTPRQLPSAPLRHMGGAGGSYWTICWLFYILATYYVHSGPRLYPLTKSAGLQISFMSCPPTCDAQKNIRWAKTRCFVLRRSGFRRPPPLLALLPRSALRALLSPRSSRLPLLAPASS
jgi:hypothetical protein